MEYWFPARYQMSILFFRIWVTLLLLNNHPHYTGGKWKTEKMANLGPKNILSNFGLGSKLCLYVWRYKTAKLTFLAIINRHLVMTQCIYTT